MNDEEYEKIANVTKRTCVENAFKMAEMARSTWLINERIEYLTAANFWLLLAILRETEK